MPNKYKKLITLAVTLLTLLSSSGCSVLKGASAPANNDKPILSPQGQSPLPSEPSSISSPDTVSSPTSEPVRLEEYDGPIYHIFFHSLIAFPEIAYSKPAGGAFDTDCVTVPEFKRALDELYKNDYILVDIHSTYQEVTENGNQLLKDKKLKLPAGKKPLVMSFDDMVYDPKKMGLGMVDKIILDAKGNFATYTKQKDGKEIISYDNEIIPILEQFVKDHPDFSYRGAKGTLALTGWVGILGYRIDRLSPNRQSEIDAVKPIIQRLKETGWSFASHGYGHRHSSQISYSLFQDDTEKWHNEIEPIVGPTEIYVYPYGDKLSVDDRKYKLLLQYGFKLMCGVNMSPSWKNYGHSIFMDRQGIDGYSLRNYHKYLLPLFDTDKVYDSENRKIR